MNDEDLRRTVLEVVEEFGTRENSALQSATVLQNSAQRLGIRQNPEAERAILAYFGDLFRIGYLAWGHDLANPAPPFCHITKRGRQTLSQMGRDPSNPDGYMQHLGTLGSMSSTTEAYIREALATYSAGCAKATAVMVGVATESIILDLRDELISRLTSLGQAPATKLSDWKCKTVLDAIANTLNPKKKSMPPQLRESFESYWPAFTQQVRASRNEAGHPASIGAVGEEAGHASLLVFPELLRLNAQLVEWIKTSLT
ncbi:MAG: hypothetical protein O6949_02965 [Chloroflexi bacterium]|nr:hypothetical protein [Chloroflexota bacterium]